LNVRWELRNVELNEALSPKVERVGKFYFQSINRAIVYSFCFLGKGMKRKKKPNC
jgi:hypothetical protein